MYRHLSGRIRSGRLEGLLVRQDLDRERQVSALGLGVQLMRHAIRLWVLVGVAEAAPPAHNLRDQIRALRLVRAVERDHNLHLVVLQHQRLAEIAKHAFEDEGLRRHDREQVLLALQARLRRYHLATVENAPVGAVAPLLTRRDNVLFTLGLLDREQDASDDVGAQASHEHVHHRDVLPDPAILAGEEGAHHAAEPGKHAQQVGSKEQVLGLLHLGRVLRLLRKRKMI